MSDTGRLLRQSAHFFSVRVVAIAMGLVSFPLVTRLLSVAQYGHLDIAQRVGVFLTGVGKLGLHQALMRRYQERSQDPEALRALVSSLLLGDMIALVPILVAYGLAILLLPEWALSADLRYPLLAVALLSGVRVIQSFGFVLLRMQDRTLLFNTFDILNRALPVAVIIALLLMWQRTPTAFLVGAAAAEGVLAVILWMLATRHGLVSWRSVQMPLLRDNLVFGLPILGYELAVVVLAYSDRPLIQHFLGSHDLGYYAAASALANYMGDALQSPLHLALFPLCIRIYNEQGEHATTHFMNRIFVAFATLSIALVAVTSANARDILVFLSGEKYLPAAPLLGPMVGATMVYLAHFLLTVGIVLRSRSPMLAPGVLFGTVGKIALGAWLIPRLGLYGAVIATWAGYVVLLAWMWRSGRQYMAYRFSPMVAVKLIAAGVLAWAAGAVMPQFEPRLLAIALRSIMTLGIYAGLLCAIEREIRELGRTVYLQFRQSVAFS